MGLSRGLGRDLVGELQESRKKCSNAAHQALLCEPCALQVAFPYLYNNRPRKVRLSAYHHPMVMYIKMEDPDLPAFYYDPLIHPIAFYKASDAAAGVDALDDDEEDAFVLPEGGSGICTGCLCCPLFMVKVPSVPWPRLCGCLAMIAWARWAESVAMAGRHSHALRESWSRASRLIIPQVHQQKAVVGLPSGWKRLPG